ncbi:MAG TPA: M20/M25/M40 family metallo-hydrolase [Patescibacteria group bacterium]|nr:M20/M25/M40 family metallo-hydrolase [Patescibacteria group bacterium]
MSGPETDRQCRMDITDPLVPTDRATQINQVIGAISGTEIERQIITLASIGGILVDPTAEQSTRYATNRLALSEADKLAAEQFTIPLMEDADMDVIQHPFGLIGILKGKNSKLDPVVIMSHTDTVPDGDMYDGTFGVIAGITAAKTIKDAGVKLNRDLIIISLTGEESSRFGFACFGSQSMFTGLSAEEMSSQDSQGQTIAEVIGAQHAETVRHPIFGPKGSQFATPHATIELHVSQDKRLDRKDMEIGVVDAIAAPMRYKVRFGDDEPLKTAEAKYNYSRYIELVAQGRADHSGATPMTPGSRIDGLLATSQLLLEMFKSSRLKDRLAIEDIAIEGQAINKIPGVTKTLLRISADTEEEIDNILNELSEQIEEVENLCLQEAEKPEDKLFFDHHEIINRQLGALVFVKAVNTMVADPSLSKENIVGTVGTFDIDEKGVITLGLDIRGTHKDSRDEIITRLMEMCGMLQPYSNVEFGKPLAGSGDPVKLNDDLAAKAMEVISKYEIGKATRMFSAAGHDAQNAARAGVPTIMLFAPSRDGIAHNPAAYTSLDHLQKSARALAALAMELGFEN